MRKVFAIIAALAVTVAASACAKKDAGPENILLASFESYDEVTLCSFSDRFGRAAINTDAAYVTEGAASLRLEPVGAYNSSARPTFTVNADTNGFGLSDFSTLTQVSFDIFNAADEARTIGFSIVGRSLNQTYALPYMTAVLTPGAWNVVTYDLSDGVIRQYNPGIGDITDLQISFYNKRTSAGAYVPDVYYLDNLRGVTGEARTYDPPREENEILNFENLGDLKTIGLTGSIELSQETSPLKVRQGNMSLRATGQGSMFFYVGSLLAGRDTAGRTLAFDILNDSRTSRSYTVSFAFNATEDELTDPVVSATVTAPPYEWYTFTLDASRIPEGRTLGDVVYMSVTAPDGSDICLDAIRMV